MIYIHIYIFSTHEEISHRIFPLRLSTRRQRREASTPSSKKEKQKLDKRIKNNDIVDDDNMMKKDQKQLVPKSNTEECDMFACEVQKEINPNSRVALAVPFSLFSNFIFFLFFL